MERRVLEVDRQRERRVVGADHGGRTGQGEPLQRQAVAVPLDEQVDLPVDEQVLARLLGRRGNQRSTRTTSLSRMPGLMLSPFARARNTCRELMSKPTSYSIHFRQNASRSGSWGVAKAHACFLPMTREGLDRRGPAGSRNR